MPELSSAQQARQRKMVDAGQAVILLSGFRAATMEAIAAEAGVAKATLYKYFPDKDAVYAAVVARVAGDMQGLFDAALAGEGVVVARIAAALAAEKKYAYRLLHSSPHAQELSGADMSGHLAPMAALNQHVEDEIARVLAPELGSNARYMAQLLIACALGIFSHAQYAEQIGPAIRMVVEKLLA